MSRARLRVDWRSRQSDIEGKLGPYQGLHVAHTGEEVDADTLTVGAVILVRPGDCVAVDGIVTRGASAVDEAMLTGEAAPVAKAVGDAVFGGTLNVGGSVLEVWRLC